MEDNISHNNNCIDDTSKKFVSVLFDVLLQHGVRNVVCSPGSRDVPLLLAVGARKMMKKYFATDERSAAFMALGIATVCQEPVAIVCTSGTALLNYAPAVAEAYYQGVPLIVVSADRPIQWIDQDDSQTLRQDEALTNYVKKSYSIPAFGEDIPEMLWFVNRIANDAVLEACGRKPGPVHINVHLGEPLGQKIKKECISPRIINAIIGDSVANKEIIKELSNTLVESKVMLVAGFCLPDAGLQKAVSDFCKLPNVTVMAETISNLHLESEAYCVDSVLTAYQDDYLDTLAPDIVISLGGALVSRKLKEYLRRNSGKIQHWGIGYTHTTVDPFMSLSLRIEVETSRFFRNLYPLLKRRIKTHKEGNYADLWKNLKRKSHEAKSQYIRRSPWSELKAFDILLNAIPTKSNLFLSNGTTIRYAQIINYPLPHASYCNRGVSGIDGSTSTAIGGALKFKGETLLITGDLSMSYDIGSLGIKRIPNNFKIIVIDNQGGGIFRFIPSTSHLTELEEYLCQPPMLPLEDLAKGYGWKFWECYDEPSLKKNLQEFFNCNNKCILKIYCDGVISAEILKGYMNVRCDN